MTMFRFFGISVALMAFGSATAFAQVQTKNQQNCINGLNKAGAKVAATQGKANAKCVKNAGKGKEADAQTCLTADVKMKGVKAAGKTVTTETKKCTEAPTFGRAPVGQINAAGVSEEVALVADVFGGDLTSAIILADTDKVAANCQASVAKSMEKIASTKVKTFLKCKKGGLAGKDVPAFTSSTDLEGCMTGLPSSDKVIKAIGKLTTTVTKKCPGVSLDATFPGNCVGAGDFATCVDEQVECRVCLLLDAMDSLSVDCDLFDNGLADLSCANAPATTTTTTTTSTTTSTTLAPAPEWGMSCFDTADCGAFCGGLGCQCGAFLDSLAVPGPSAMCFFDCVDLGGTVEGCRSSCGGPASAPACETSTAGAGGYDGVVTGPGACEPSGFAAGVSLGGSSSELKRVIIDFGTPIDELSLFSAAPPPCSGSCPSPGSDCDGGAPYPATPAADVFRLQMGAAAPPSEMCDRLGVATTACKFSSTGYALILDSPICTPVPIDVSMFLSCHVSAGSGSSFLHFSTGDFFATSTWPP